jgi:hypothetical protein
MLTGILDAEVNLPSLMNGNLDAVSNIKRHCINECASSPLLPRVQRAIE